MDKVVKGLCKICDGSVQFNIGEMTKEEAETKFKSIKTWHCNAGNHVELISPIELYSFDWENMVDYKPVSQNEFYENLKKSYKEVYTLDELQKNYKINGFLMGSCVCSSKENSDNTTIFDFTHDSSGKRYYFANPLEKELERKEICR